MKKMYEYLYDNDEVRVTITNAIKEMRKFAESEKDSIDMLRNYCPENFYSGAKRFCETKELETYPIWQQCLLCWMQSVKEESECG